MKSKLLGLAAGASLLLGLSQLAVAAPVMAPASPVQMSVAQASGVEQVYYYRRGAVVTGPRGNTCAGGRRCVGGYYRGVCRSWAVCR